MQLSHVHLLLNHFPVIGFVIGLALLLIGAFTKSDDLKRASFVVLFLIALIAIPTYLSGNAAQEDICPPPNCGESGVSLALIQQHEDAAFWSFCWMELTGFLAWMGLWLMGRRDRLPGWTVASVLALSIITLAATLTAAEKGAEIRHPETTAAAGPAAAAAPVAEAAQAAPVPAAPVAPAAVPATAAQPTTEPRAEAAQAEPAAEGAPEVQGMVRSLGLFVVGRTWVWPACETLHFVGLCLIFAVVLIVDLRILGIGKRLSYSALYQLLPFGMVGFGLNLVTGMMFFVASPQQYTRNIMFYWKILLVVIGGINVLYFTVLREPWKIESDKRAPLTAQIVAACALVVWFGVLYCGEMLPFKGNSF